MPPESIAAMVPLLVALPSAKAKAKAWFAKPPEFTALNEPLLVKVSVSTTTNALLRMPPEFAASIVALLVTLLASTKTEARLKLPPEAVARFRALTLPLLMTELPPSNRHLCIEAKAPRVQSLDGDARTDGEVFFDEDRAATSGFYRVPDLIVSSMRARKAPEPKAPMFA